MTIFELAKKYYPDFWNLFRITKLVRIGQLARNEYKEITGKTWVDEE